jgi:trehalose 6-phosphate phosphatase
MLRAIRSVSAAMAQRTRAGVWYLEALGGKFPPSNNFGLAPAPLRRKSGVPSRLGKAPVHSLLDCWAEVARRVRASKDLRLFLDFDGTLVDFRSRPDEVTLKPEMRMRLRKLAAHPFVHVAIVSGRRRASLIQYIKVPRVQFLGLYGWEREAGMHLPEPTIHSLSQARMILGDLPNQAPGIFIEDKGLSLAVHFREASPAAGRKGRSCLRRASVQFREHLHIMRGSNVWELLPREILGKGFALREILRGLRRPFLPFYLGDDLTDEEAFAALRTGITVLAGPPRRTQARYRLSGTGEVSTFLQLLEAELP